MATKRIIGKFFSYLVVFLIFFFLGKTLFGNWQKLREYEFSFNYFYLIVSFLFLILALFLSGVIWKIILEKLEPKVKISYPKAVKIVIFSSFGKYLPGTVWQYLGRIQLASREGLEKKLVAVSLIYEIILSIISAFLFSLVILSFSAGMFFSFFYNKLIITVTFLIILSGFFLIHPKIFYFLFNFILKKFNKEEIPAFKFLTYKRILMIIFCYFIFFFLSGIGFSFLVKSLVSFPVYGMMWLTGAFILASILGMIVVFAPSGLGVREGVLVLFLQFYFPLSVAVVISLAARLWATLGEIITLGFIYSYCKFKKL